MPRPPKGQSEGLSAERIYARALELAEAHGAEALSMRRLGRALGVDAMSLYYYVPNKAALLRGVYALVLARLELPAEGDWQARLRTLAHNVRALAHAYPKLFPQLLAAPALSERDFEIFEALYGALSDAGLEPEDVVKASRALFAFIAGFVLAELSGSLAPPDTREQAFAQALPEARFAHTRRLGALAAATDAAQAFEYGLEKLLGGLGPKAPRE